MGMNPLVGHKVDRYWADVRLLRSPLHLRRNPSLLLCLRVLMTPRLSADCGFMGDCEQDKKWWNGIITDYNGLSKEHWWAPLHPGFGWLSHPFRPVVVVCQQGARRSCSTVPTI